MFYRGLLSVTGRDQLEPMHENDKPIQRTRLFEPGDEIGPSRPTGNAEMDNGCPIL